MKTLLAVDGSDNSYEAVHMMKYMARAEQLTLLHALSVPRPAYPMMLPEVAEGLYKTLEGSMREDGERLLNRVQSLLPLHAGPMTKHLQMGSPAEVIVSIAEEQKADLIVMGARGLGPIKERLLGSVSHRILTLAHCATLIVNGPVKAMKQILLPLQGPSDTESAIRFLQLKPFHDAVEVTLLTVLPSTEPPWPGDAYESATTSVATVRRYRYVPPRPLSRAPQGFRRRAAPLLLPQLLLQAYAWIDPDQQNIGDQRADHGHYAEQQHNGAGEEHILGEQGLQE